MNTIESCYLESPFGKEEECAQFVIDDITIPFIFRNIAVVGQNYTMSLWIKSDGDYTTSIYARQLTSSATWNKHVIKFTATMSDVELYFNAAGTYYIYHPQLEIGTKESDWKVAPEDADQKIDDTEAGLRKVISENHTAILQDCEQIILGAMESYTETGDFEAYKKVVENQLKVLSDQTTFQFTQTTSRLNEINGSLQEQLNTITKYFTFNVNGLTIGQHDNPYKVIIDNDRYSMTVNDVEVMWIADGKVYTPEIEVTRAFKLFGYLIDQDQNGNVNCAYVGGE